MAGQEAVARRSQRDADLGARSPGSSGAGSECGVAMGQVQDPRRHLRRRAVGGDVAQADDGRRDRRARLPGQHRNREAEDVERLVERLGGERRDRAPRRGGGRAARPFGALPAPHDSAARVPVVGRCRKRSTAAPHGASVDEPPDERQLAGAEVEDPFAGARRRPGRLGRSIAPARRPGTARAAAYSRRKATSPGSSITPLSMPLSQWSKNRTISCSQSRFGPG